MISSEFIIDSYKIRAWLEYVVSSMVFLSENPIIEFVIVIYLRKSPFCHGQTIIFMFKMYIVKI